MRSKFWLMEILLLGTFYMQVPVAQTVEVPEELIPIDIGPTGIDIKRPVFAGACKACPWGVLASVTRDALKPYGYDVEICWVCWSFYGPTIMGDKTIPTIPPGAEQYLPVGYVEAPPKAVPDISATSEVNLIEAYEGIGRFAKDKKQRRNYRVIAVVHQPNFMLLAASKKSGITDLSQIKDRKQPTWIAFTSEDEVVEKILGYYGISEEALEAKGGGYIDTRDRDIRAAADVFIGGAVLANTPEQRMWYEVSQLNDLVYFNIPEVLLTKLDGARSGAYKRSTAPIAFLRGMERPIETLMRSTHVIYVRDEAPESFSYDVAKALDEHQDLFMLHGDPFYYDTRTVANSKIVPMAEGAMRYYREKGYIK